jgi:hypothetical protein
MTPEKKIKKKILEYLKSVPGCFHFCIEQRPGMGRGVADIIVSYRGRIIAIETKAPGNNPTPLQKHFGEKLTESGGVYIVAYGIENINHIIN